jgi:hypothetical protein
MRAFYSSRGACFDDFDNDGRIDVVVLNSRELPTVMHNRVLPPETTGFKSN